ncbi:MAG: hypothetical protein IJK84_00655 [Bacteroidales bacterium]|nr:hypothetical protein [Bacteroidales bacterium]
MKRVVVTLFIIAALCLSAEGIYRCFFYQHDRHAFSAPLAQMVDSVNATGADILYLGESSNHTFGLDDKDTAWISEMVARHFPRLTVRNMTHDASHGEVYYLLLRNISPDCSISTVVVTLNLRSFGIEWIASPLETVLQKRLVMLHPRPALLNRAILSFKAYDIKNVDERYQQMDSYWAAHPLPGHPSVPRWGDSLNTDSTTMPGIFVRNYGFQIDTLNNPRIRDFDRIVALARERGWNLVFNLLAEDVEWADQLVGDDLTTLMRQNADLIVGRYRRMGVTVVDNLCSLPDSLFRDRDWTTEHYVQAGRQIIADNVSQALFKFYEADYE